MTDNGQGQEETRGGELRGAAVAPQAAEPQKATEEKPETRSESRDVAEARDIQSDAARLQGDAALVGKTLERARGQSEAGRDMARELLRQIAESLETGEALKTQVKEMIAQARSLKQQQAVVMRYLTTALKPPDTAEKHKQIAEDFRKALQAGYWPGVTAVVRDTVEQTHEDIKRIVRDKAVWARRLYYAGQAALALWGVAILALALWGAWALIQ